MATGRSRWAFLSSLPANPTLFHASIENSEPTIAADGHAQEDQQRERAGLDRGEGRLDEGRRAHAADVDPREQRDRQDGEYALRRKADRDVADRLREVHGESEEHVGREAGPEDAREPRERDRNRRDRAGLNDHEQRPAVQVAEQRRDTLAQIHILSPRAGEHRGQLAVRERAHEGDDARHRPDDEQQARSMDFTEHLRRDDEDPRPDHRPDHQGRGIEPGDRLDEIGLWLLGSGHWRGNLVAPAWGRYVPGRRNDSLTRGPPCASCPGKKNSSTCSSRSPRATRSRPSISAGCSTRPPSAASRRSKRSSAWSTRPTRSRTRW